MKIIFDASPLLVNKTGVAYYTEQLVDALANEYPDDVALSGFYFNFLGRRDTQHLQRTKNIRYSRFSLIPSKIIFQLRRFGIECPIELLAAGRGDFVLYDNFIGYPSLSHIPSATVIHDLAYIDLPEYVSAKLRRDLVRFMPKTIKRASFVITVSEFSKKRIMEIYGLPADKIVVTPIPPQTPRFRKPEVVQHDLNELGVTAKPYILFLGTIEPRKNIPNLIDAYLKLPQAIRTKYNLVIAGMIGWNCDKEVAKLRETKGQGVIHVGYVGEQQRAALYQRASLFVHASYYEGFGMPVLEAMSYGAPCAISDIPIYREVADSAAVFFNQEDPNFIAQAIAGLLDNTDRRQQFAEKGKAHVATYSWQKSAQAVYEAIKKSLPAA